ncbi:hypothetical protein [Virgisporangium aliadipatigenens]|nr:hypothetical protein [Virgisporangium aliadipatigenens]
MGGERRRRRLRRADRPRAVEPEAAPVDEPEPEPAPAPRSRPSPADLAGMAGPFALTASVHDPEPAEPVVAPEPRADYRGDESSNERGLRGLVGGGSSQVNVRAAMRARDASRPTDEDLAEAERALAIVRRGWVPREDLPRPGHRH